MYKPPKVPTFNEIEIKKGKFVNSNSNSGGFFVRDAPWQIKSNQQQTNDPNTRPDTNNVEEFPSMGNNSEAKNAVWVPK